VAKVVETAVVDPTIVTLDTDEGVAAIELVISLVETVT
jgi:hypothetical protein